MQCNSIKPYRSYQPCYVFARWIFGCSCVQYGVCSRMVRKLIITRTPCTRNLHFSPPPPPAPPFKCAPYSATFFKICKALAGKARAHACAHRIARSRQRFALRALLEGFWCSVAIGIALLSSFCLFLPQYINDKDLVYTSEDVHTLLEHRSCEF